MDGPHKRRLGATLGGIVSNHASNHAPLSAVDNHNPITPITPDHETAGQGQSREQSRQSRTGAITHTPPSLEGVWVYSPGVDAQREETMSATRPERVDEHGLHHRHGCRGKVTSRPALTREGWIVRQCECCRAVSVEPDPPTAQLDLEEP